jgi:predicted PurR-regulated permease PerM
MGKKEATDENNGRRNPQTFEELDRAAPRGKESSWKNFPILLLALSIMSAVVVSPLVYGIAWGSVFAFVWRKPHMLVGRLGMLKSRPNLHAAVSILLLLICFTTPLVYMVQSVVSELISAYEAIPGYAAMFKDSELPSLTNYLPRGVADFISPMLSDRERISGILTSLARNVATFLQNLSSGVLQWTGSFIFQGFISMTTAFFLTRDGESITLYIRDLIPLPSGDRENFVRRTASMMNSVIYGVILTVAAQAVLGGIGWKIAGLPNATLASAAMFMFGMFPAGTAIVWLPGGLYLIAGGSAGWGVGFIAWGAIVVSSIDNILRPIFIGGGNSIPTLAIIIGLTGGITAWGFLGVFLGPLTLALFLSVLDLYRTSVRR